MTVFRIVDITNSRTLGTVDANTERGARIVASRTFNTRYDWVAAYVVETVEETMEETIEDTVAISGTV